MSDLHNDINDDEIRVISSDCKSIRLQSSDGDKRLKSCIGSSAPCLQTAQDDDDGCDFTRSHESRMAEENGDTELCEQSMQCSLPQAPLMYERKLSIRPRLIFWALLALVLIAVLAVLFFSAGEDKSSYDASSGRTAVSAAVPVENFEKPTEGSAVAAPYTIRTDTVVDDIGLSILMPVNATPVLEIGSDVPYDSIAVLAVQAADLRGDNGDIVGSFVVRGNLVSKGESKSGFCSIINGELTLGVADATPKFEEALSADGYFFRQYPLVVGGQIVENKPKGKSIRRALAEINGRICVVISQDRTTFHDFSQALVDVGASNAIYLVGGDACGRYVDSFGKSFTFGEPWYKDIDNVNYIVWR